eukprot:s3554_g4.t1
MFYIVFALFYLFGGHCTTKFIKFKATLNIGCWAKPRCPASQNSSFDFLWHTSARWLFELRGRPLFPDTLFQPKVLKKVSLPAASMALGTAHWENDCLSFGETSQCTMCRGYCPSNRQWARCSEAMTEEAAVEESEAVEAVEAAEVEAPEAPGAHGDAPAEVEMVAEGRADDGHDGPDGPEVKEAENVMETPMETPMETEERQQDAEAIAVPVASQAEEPKDVEMEEVSVAQAAQAAPEVEMEVETERKDVVEVVDDDEAEDKDERHKRKADHPEDPPQATPDPPPSSEHKLLVVRNLPESASRLEWFHRNTSAGKVVHVSWFGPRGSPRSAVIEADSPMDAAALAKELNGASFEGRNAKAEVIDQEERRRLLQERHLDKAISRSAHRNRGGRYPNDREHPNDRGREVVALREKVVELENRVVVLESLVRDLLRRQHDEVQSASSALPFPVLPDPASCLEPLSENAREVLEGKFPPVPEAAVQLCSKLRGGQYSSQHRARRAWVAGCWAKLVLDNKVAQASLAPVIDLANTSYVLLRSDSCSTPRLFEELGSYQKACQGSTCRPVGHGFASKSEARVYCLAAEVKYGLAIVVRRRHGAGGGVLLALPANLMTMESLLQLATGEEDALVGAFHFFNVPAVRNSQEGLEPLEQQVSVVVVDLGLEVLFSMSPLSQVSEEEDADIVGFAESLDILPSSGSLLSQVASWLSALTDPRVTFYSAEEGVEVADIDGHPLEEGDLEELPKAAPLPSRTKAKEAAPKPKRETAEEKSPVAGDPLAQAVLEQSKALTSLVAHLQQGGDPLVDGHGSSSGGSLGTRGSVGRERLQRELAARSGGFFLSVLQNAARRLRPASRLPESIEALSQTDFSMIQYLERFGGYGQSKELGLIQFALAHIADALVHGDTPGAQEHLALLMVGVEQACMDHGRWELAYRLMLLEEPPSQLWSYRPSGYDPKLKAFAPLCPQRWTTVALAYSKEIDYIHQKRSEMSSSAKSSNQKPADPAQPKKKGRFPRGKANQDAEKEGS